MTWAYVLRPREMATFRRCRRAWDFGARIRRNYVPATAHRVFDFDKAIHDALAVYYFPAMDDWDRAIVRPLAVKGFCARSRRTVPGTSRRPRSPPSRRRSGTRRWTGGRRC